MIYCVNNRKLVEIGVRINECLISVRNEKLKEKADRSKKDGKTEADKWYNFL